MSGEKADLERDKQAEGVERIDLNTLNQAVDKLEEFTASLKSAEAMRIYSPSETPRKENLSQKEQRQAEELVANISALSHRMGEKETDWSLTGYIVAALGVAASSLLYLLNI